MLNQNDLKKLDHSAKIRLEKTDLEEFHKKLDMVMIWIQEIQSIETKDCEPLVNIVSEENADILESQKNQTEKLNYDDVFLNTKNHDEKYFLIPKVI